MLKHALLTVLLLPAGLAFSQPPDDVKAVKAQLETERVMAQKQLADPKGNTANTIRRILTLGLWPEAVKAINSQKSLRNIDRQLLRATYAWLNNDFRQTESLVKQVLAKDPANVDGRRMKATLAIEAWKLQNAVDQCKALLAKNPADVETVLVLGRALLLQKRYPDALAVAKQLQQTNPSLGAAYLLEANVYFWDQQPAQAEAPLLKSLTLDPF
ncbi:MAG: tetratricopeptide repeat protein, partial [Rudanella sp.]|nr:tetratricopeptide repeat protein [Rudanella sp.]